MGARRHARPATSPAPTPTPGHRHRRRRPQARGPDHRQPGPRQRLAHAPGQDRHGQPGRQHDRRGRLAPARPPRRARARHRRALAGRRASSGASTAATSSDASSNNHEVRVAGNGVHTLETRIVDNAGRAQRLEGAHDQARRDGCRPTRTPAAPDGLAQHALLGRAQRHRRAAPASPRSAGAIELERRARGRRARGHAQRRPASSSTHDGTHTLEHPRPRHRRQLLDLARRDDPHRPRRCRPTTTAYPVGAGRQPPHRHLRPAGRPLGRRRRRVEARRRRRQDHADGHDHRRRRAHAVASASQDNAGNWSAWARPLDHGRPRRSTRTAPTDTTVDPDGVAARRRTR